ncbi:hypothetical protein N483_12810 [Pseudoalteromonas luteoviolacea NCIMB 1944]|nr:hypothetical protein N483_12810 [Pseudoalteromonas luteoviolacea NCIMB 1944]
MIQKEILARQPKNTNDKIKKNYIFQLFAIDIGFCFYLRYLKLK